MERLTRFCDRLDAIVAGIGRIAAWASVALMIVIVFDVITRRFFVLGSTKLQEFEWHLHTILFALCLGWAYLSDAHVRIDLVREKLSPRAQRWIEVIGILLFLVPYSLLIIYYGYDFVLRSFLQGETSASATGLGYRWLIKSMIPVGFVLLLVAGFVVLVRKLVALFGPRELSEHVAEIERAERKPAGEIAPDNLG